MRKPFTEWRCNLILFLCVLEKRGDVVKLTIVTLKTLFFFFLLLFFYLVML